MKVLNDASTVTLERVVEESISSINSYWPLTNFIACNALKGFEKDSFEKTMRLCGQMFGAQGFLPLSEYRALYESGRISPSALANAFSKHQTKSTEGEPDKQAPVQIQKTLSETLDLALETRITKTINEQMIKWCGAYLDKTQAQWSPEDKNGFYKHWKELAKYDLSMWWHGCRDWSDAIDSLPESSLETLALMFDKLEVPCTDKPAYLTRHILQLPGFASYLKFKKENEGECGIITDYLAVRLFYEYQLSKVRIVDSFKTANIGEIKKRLEATSQSQPPAIDQVDYSAVWQDAYEHTYRNKLLASLNRKATSERNTCCQLVFCIDVRSEPIRRELEQKGPYSTYGFAGFFAMPMRFTPAGSNVSFDLCPVLLKPERDVHERATKETAHRLANWQAIKASALLLKKKVKCNLAATFGLVELLGFWSSVTLVAKTFFPKLVATAAHKVEDKLANSALELDASSFSLPERVALAEGALKGIGLTTFGKVIVLCGHKSSTVNNPYASSLDCGACGGNGGGYSARLATEFLNDHTVRSELQKRGINVPADTLFLAAEHDTTTDLFTLFECGTLTDEHRTIVEKLKADLLEVGRKVREKRTSTLPKSGSEKTDSPLHRAVDWAQIAPEWGLAGNAAFIAGPRSLTADCDLEGRVFLHSYEHSCDQDGKILELILTAPLVVAQWINMQYYLSTVDNKVFGSGSKVTHNVIGDFGVMQGAASDLKIGLPLQSVMTSEGLRHEPMRLLAVIRASRASIDRVLQKHQNVSQLISNRWISLVAIEPDSEEFYEAEAEGVWQLLDLSQKTSSDHGLQMLTAGGSGLRNFM